MLAEVWDDRAKCGKAVEALYALFKQVRAIPLKTAAEAGLDAEWFVCAVVMVARLTVAAAQRLREVVNLAAGDATKTATQSPNLT